MVSVFEKAQSQQISDYGPIYVSKLPLLVIFIGFVVIAWSIVLGLFVKLFVIGQRVKQLTFNLRIGRSLSCPGYLASGCLFC